MKGLSLEQFKEVVEFVQKYHSFGILLPDVVRKKLKEKYPNFPEYGYTIKYIDSCYDSRFRNIWNVTFRGLGKTINFSVNHFVLKETPKDWKYDNLFDLIMDYLKGDFVLTEDFYVKDK
jgi:hypothetical protein